MKPLDSFFKNIILVDIEILFTLLLGIMIMEPIILKSGFSTEYPENVRKYLVSKSV